MTAPMPVMTDRLPLTRRAMARYRRWVDADQWTRKGTEQEISAAEVAALERLRGNLAGIDWNKAFTEAATGTVRLSRWAQAQLLAGLELAPEAVPDLIRAAGIGDGWRQRALEKALAERAAARQQAVCRVTETKQEQTEMSSSNGAGTGPNSGLTKKERVLRYLAAQGVDIHKEQVSTALKEAAAAACDTTAMTVGAFVTEERARVRGAAKPQKPRVAAQNDRESASAPNPVSEEAPAQKTAEKASETPLSGQADEPDEYELRASVESLQNENAGLRFDLERVRRSAEEFSETANLRIQMLEAELEQARQQTNDSDLTDEQRKRALQIVMALDAPMSEAVAILRLAAKLAEVAAA